MIQINDLTKSYRLGTASIPVLRQLNVHIEPGDFIALTGKSGSGKSTLLNIIGLLDHYDTGEYLFNGKLMKNITETQAARFRNEHIGFVFQSFNLLPFKSALDNVTLPLHYQGNLKKREIEIIAKEMLEKVGLADRMHHLPNELSGGQKQRVAIARALITNAGLILADEPTGALDTSTSNEILDLLNAIGEEGKTIIIVTHDKDIAARCKKTMAMVDGEISS